MGFSEFLIKKKNRNGFLRNNLRVCVKKDFMQKSIKKLERQNALKMMLRNFIKYFESKV